MGGWVDGSIDRWTPARLIRPTHTHTTHPTPTRLVKELRKLFKRGPEGTLFDTLDALVVVTSVAGETEVGLYLSRESILAVHGGALTPAAVARFLAVAKVGRKSQWMCGVWIDSST